MDNDSKTVESLYNNFIVEIENVFKKDSELCELPTHGKADGLGFMGQSFF